MLILAPRGRRFPCYDQTPDSLPAATTAMLDKLATGWLPCRSQCQP